MNNDVIYNLKFIFCKDSMKHANNNMISIKTAQGTYRHDTTGAIHFYGQHPRERGPAAAVPGRGGVARAGRLRRAGPGGGARRPARARAAAGAGPRAAAVPCARPTAEA